MKTTTSTVLATKIEQLVIDKHLNRNSIIFDWLMQVVEGVQHLRPVYLQGAGNSRRGHDRTAEITSALKSLDIEFTLTNDDSIGAMMGALITITSKVKQL